jgi:ABC-2 type transport system permease protein
MHAIATLALKDLRLLLRNRASLFFTFVWPLLVAIGLGAMLGGSMGGGSKVGVALVDEDGSARSAAFLARLEAATELDAGRTSRAEAEDAVRTGRRTAFVIVPEGFGEASERLFYGTPPAVELGVDPSRRAESGMLEGVLMKYGVQEMQTVFSDPRLGHRAVENARQSLSAGRDTTRDPEAASTAAFLAELDKYLQRPRTTASTREGQGFGGAGWTPLAVVRRDVAADERGPRSSFEFTFPQGVIWGLIGCIMSFAVGLVVERTHGTLVRLQTAPLSRAAVLAGKGLGCFLAAMALQAAMFALAVGVFGVRVSSYAALLAAMTAAAGCFVGIMMLVASAGRNEQSTSAAGWAFLMPMSMIGGAMIPLFAMPPWLGRLSVISPVRWAILALEGATWRAFSYGEMLLPCAVLLGVGLVAFGLGTRFVRTM